MQDDRKGYDLDFTGTYYSETLEQNKSLHNQQNQGKITAITKGDGDHSTSMDTNSDRFNPGKTNDGNVNRSGSEYEEQDSKDNVLRSIVLRKRKQIQTNPRKIPIGRIR